MLSRRSASGGVSGSSKALWPMKRRLSIKLSPEHWHAYLNDPTLADAILDRILHSAHKLALAGESIRKPEKNKP